MLSGSDFAKLLLTSGPSKTGITGVARENLILQVFEDQGLVPAGGGGIFDTITSSQVIAGKTRTLEFDVSPVPCALGSGSDFFLIPAWPWTYQAMASKLDYVIPTRKLALLVAQAASVRVEPHPFSTSDGGFANESSGRYVQSNGQCLSDLLALGWKPPALVSGLKKDLVIGPNLDGSKVAIFGWFHASGPQDDSSLGRWQPYSTIHESAYADYSHSWRVLRNSCKLDGLPASLKDLCADKLLWPLVSDHGPFLLEFPNKFPSVSPPAGYTPGIIGGATKKSNMGPALETAKTLGSAALGGVAGFAVAGPVGAMFGAALGAAIGRSK